MNASDAFTLEPGNQGMFRDYTALFNAVDSFDNPDHIELSKEYFRSSFSYPTIDLSRDIVLVRNSSGDLIASGAVITHDESSKTSRLTIQVHPEYRRQGIGTKILVCLTEIGLKRGLSVFVCRFPNFRPHVATFVKRHGFSHDHTLTKMRIEHKKPVTTTPLPRGLIVRGLNIKKELSLWAQLQNTIFKDKLDYEAVDVESLRLMTKHSSFDRNLLVICKVYDTPVGYCMGFSVQSETGEKILKIDAMGVLPEYRRKGYGQALIFEILNRAYIKGHTSSELLVLNTNQAAINLYEKCGFRERYRYMRYKRTVE